jgi:hypothetical protein
MCLAEQSRTSPKAAGAATCGAAHHVIPFKGEGMLESLQILQQSQVAM